MLEKRLGKIDFAEFGSMKDYPFQLGLQLGFSMSGNGIMDGGKYTVNMSPDCHWEMGTRHTNAKRVRTYPPATISEWRRLDIYHCRKQMLK